MKTAIVYDRVNKWGGAEVTLLALHEIFPDAPLYTSVYNPKRAPWAKVFPKVFYSYLQKIPLASTRHEHLAPLMPSSFELFNFDEYELVISVTSEAAKGIITKPGTLHVCLCLTPTRYLWSQYDLYFRNSLFKTITKPVVAYLRSWDRIASNRPDLLVANSKAVRARIKKYYGRESEVIYPPVDLDNFSTAKLKTKKKNYYLVVSRLVKYKKVDLAIRAFNELDKPLIIVGIGSEERNLKKSANKNIEFAGYLTHKELARYYQEARALVFPQEEDFGITAVEAQAAGTPVIAYSAGGARETVINKKTGLFFNKQTKDSLIVAIEKFETLKFKESNLINNANKYSTTRFRNEILKLIN